VLLGTPTPGTALHVFHRAWAIIALTGAVAAVAGVFLGRVRARYAGEEQASAGAVAALPAGARRR